MRAIYSVTTTTFGNSISTEVLQTKCVWLWTKYLTNFKKFNKVLDSPVQIKPMANIHSCNDKSTKNKEGSFQWNWLAKLSLLNWFLSNKGKTAKKFKYRKWYLQWNVWLFCSFLMPTSGKAKRSSDENNSVLLLPGFSYTSKNPPWLRSKYSLCL